MYPVHDKSQNALRINFVILYVLSSIRIYSRKNVLLCNVIILLYRQRRSLSFKTISGYD